MTNKNHMKNRGVTLIELSVAMLVIGLIAGAIVSASVMLKNSRLQSVLVDVDRIKNATQLFRDKYQELPGDYTKAATVWGVDATCPNTAANIVTKVATCNGGGDGFIGNALNTPSSIDTTVLSNGNPALETLRFWQHLADAGVYTGSFSGAVSSTTNGIDIGVNTPKMQLPGGTYSIFYVNPLNTPPLSAYTAPYGHIIVFGAVNNTANTDASKPPAKPILTPDDALSLDKKIDDGLPALGKILSYTNDGSSPASGCATSAASTATYYLANNGIVCSLIFITGF